MLLNPLQLHLPTSLAEAVELYGKLSNARIVSGGTFLMNSLKLLKRNSAKTPEHVISLKKIKELNRIELTNEFLDIYSMTTINELYDSKDLVDNFLVLRQVCKNISTTPIRNMATVGGNLTCRYTWTEMPAVMVALDAQMFFIGKDGKEEVVSASDFFKQAAKTDKILQKIRIRREKDVLIAYQRVKKSLHVDIPLLSLCIKAKVDKNIFRDVSVGVNNCVAFAQRDNLLEQFLNSKAATEETVLEALNHVDANIYDNRSSDYKKYIFRVCLKNALLEIIHKSSGEN